MYRAKCLVSPGCDTRVSHWRTTFFSLRSLVSSTRATRVVACSLSDSNPLLCTRQSSTGVSHLLEIPKQSQKKNRDLPWEQVAGGQLSKQLSLDNATISRKSVSKLTESDKKRSHGSEKGWFHRRRIDSLRSGEEIADYLESKQFDIGEDSSVYGYAMHRSWHHHRDWTVMQAIYRVIRWRNQSGANLSRIRIDFSRLPNLKMSRLILHTYLCACADSNSRLHEASVEFKKILEDKELRMRCIDKENVTAMLQCLVSIGDTRECKRIIRLTSDLIDPNIEYDSRIDKVLLKACVKSHDFITADELLKRRLDEYNAWQNGQWPDQLEPFDECRFTTLGFWSALLKVYSVSRQPEKVESVNTLRKILMPMNKEKNKKNKNEQSMNGDRASLARLLVSLSSSYAMNGEFDKAEQVLRDELSENEMECIPQVFGVRLSNKLMQMKEEFIDDPISKERLFNEMQSMLDGLSLSSKIEWRDRLLLFQGLICRFSHDWTIVMNEYQKSLMDDSGSEESNTEECDDSGSDHCNLSIKNQGLLGILDDHSSKPNSYSQLPRRVKMKHEKLKQSKRMISSESRFGIVPDAILGHQKNVIDFHHLNHESAVFMLRYLFSSHSEFRDSVKAKEFEVVLIVGKSLHSSKNSIPIRLSIIREMKQWNLPINTNEHPHNEGIIICDHDQVQQFFEANPIGVTDFCQPSIPHSRTFIPI